MTVRAGRFLCGVGGGHLVDGADDDEVGALASMRWPSQTMSVGSVRLRPEVRTMTRSRAGVGVSGGGAQGSHLAFGLPAAVLEVDEQDVDGVHGVEG